MIEQKRLLWLDTAKALAMIAVVFSHEFSSVEPLVVLCNSFMLPLFFMCSGFCLSPGKYSMNEYIKRKSRSLLLPYFALGLIVSLLHIGISGIEEVVLSIEKELFSWQTLWFLPVLFFADIILYVFLSKSRKILVMNVSVGLISLILGIVFCKLGFSIFVNLGVVPIAMFYLSVGYGVKRLFGIQTISSNKLMLGSCILFFGLVVMVVTKGNLVLKYNDILPISKLAFSTLEGVGIMYILSSVITPPILQKFHVNIHLLVYIGKNTMAIFAFHMPVFFYSQAYIRPIFTNQFFYKPVEFILIWGICLMLIPLFNQYVPVLIGKK